MAVKRTSKASSAKETTSKHVASAVASRTEKENLKQDPKAAAKKAESARVKKSAEAAIDTNLFSPEVKQQYADVVADLAAKKQELNDLYGIDAEAVKIADLITAHNLTQVELDEEAFTAESEREASKDAVVKQCELLEKEAREKWEKTQKELKETEAEYKKSLDQQRQREAEEYKYNLDRTHSKEDDEWNDLKTKREKELSAKEADADARLKEVIEREKKLDDLEAQVASIPEKVKQATEEGKAAGKAEADKSNAFEKRYLNKEHEAEVNLLKQQVESLTKQLADINVQKSELQTRLDESYKRAQELATTVAQNSGSKTYVQAAETTQTTGKSGK